ncbi:MAG: tRNA (N(6)-L-threonylcarbamoyladenosine(37)-C(2))-methylthiotransferase MtaB [Candidatus Acidiferrales bacterium]
MATFSIENFGCRATDADATAIRSDLVSAGLVAVKDHCTSDFVVLNTCTVTAAADTQARDAVRKIHRANPAARIVLTGCFAQRAPEELAALDGVAYVVGNSHQSLIASLVEDLAGSGATRKAVLQGSSAAVQGDFVALERLDAEPMSLARGPAKILTGDIFEQSAVSVAPMAERDSDRTRPILKVQDGCNNRCAYCVIPFVRGKSRSLPPAEIVAEIHKLVDAGSKEAVLSGINLGAYGRDLSPRVELGSVVRRILEETGLEQLRFSSIEPQDVTEDFVMLAASSPRIAPHFHIPLQSGSDKILKAMHRWYRTSLYTERVRLIRRLLPHAGIGADVIAGFPGETEADFRSTVDFIEALPFTYLHVFSFSARPGTGAESLGDKVNEGTIHERARVLRAIGRRKAQEFRTSLNGESFRAITLARRGPGYTEGLTGNYLKVRIAGELRPNQWRDAEIQSEESIVANREEVALKTIGRIAIPDC